MGVGMLSCVGYWLDGLIGKMFVFHCGRGLGHRNWVGQLSHRRTGRPPLKTHIHPLSQLVPPERDSLF